jgi:hypothetical protein
MSGWREQEVMNETRSREINEWIDEANESTAGIADPFVCECSELGCTSTFTLTHVEYEEVRSDGTHFAIATNHENPDLDVLLSQRIGFAIIRKLPGMPSRLALAADPRR